jgi:ribose transport system substrate-binding protein
MNTDIRKRFIFVLVTINAVILFIAAFIVFRGGDYSANGKADSYLIGASYMTMNNEFYTIISEEISARVEAEGDRIILRDPALNADRQSMQIEEMLGEGIDVLVVTPVDLESINEVLNAAREQGVYIIVIDTNVSDENLADCTITSDNYNAGVIVGKYFMEQNDQANVVLMTHDTAQSGLDRIQGFTDTVAEADGIHIVQNIECMGQLEIAMPKMKEAIDSGVEFDSVFCLNDLASVGVVAALDEAELNDTVSVYGVDGSPDSKALIEEGMMQASAAQFPTKLGSEAADVIYKLLSGEAVDKNILVPVEMITRENVSEYGTDRWQ